MPRSVSKSSLFSLFNAQLPFKVIIHNAAKLPHSLLNKADYAIVTSGTATLETALFKVPQIVCYKTNWLTYCIAKLAIKVNYLSLVNILMDKVVVKELIQSELNAKNLKVELNNLMNKKESIIDDYEKLIKLLGSSGASKKAAQFIIESI